MPPHELVKSHSETHSVFKTLVILGLPVDDSQSCLTRVVTLLNPLSENREQTVNMFSGGLFGMKLKKDSEAKRF